MIKIHGYKKGAQVSRARFDATSYQPGIIPGSSLQIIEYPICSPEAQFSENVRGSISSWPSGYTDQGGKSWNNCIHHEAYGEMFLTPYDSDGQPIQLAPTITLRKPLPEGWILDQLPFSLDDLDLVYQLGIEGIMQGVGRSKWVISSCYLHGPTIKPDYYEGRFTHRAELVIYNYETNQCWWQLWWIQSNDEAYKLQANLGVRVARAMANPIVREFPEVAKANRKGMALDNLKTYLKNEYQLADQQLASYYDSEKSEMFRDAVLQSRDLTVMNTVAQTIGDGLVLQSLTQIARAGPEELGRVIERLRKLQRSFTPKDVGKYTLQSLQSAYQTASSMKLGYEYGVKAPLRDYADIAQFVATHLHGYKGYFWQAHVERRQETLTNGTLSCVVGINYDPLEASSGEHFMALINQVGLGLTPSDLWDLVPLSFAVDWIININDYIEYLDAQLIGDWIPITFAWRTLKFEGTRRHISLPGIDGTIRIETYDRHVSESELQEALPSSIIDILHTGNGTGTLSVRNADEAAAMLPGLVAKGIGFLVNLFM